MEAFSVTTTLTVADWRALMRAWARRRRTEPVSRTRTLVAVGGALVAAAVMFVLQSGRTPFQFSSVFVGFGAGLAICWISNLMARRGAVPNPDGVFLGPCVTEFRSDGIRHERTDTTSFIGWACVRSIEATADHLFVWVDRIAAYIVPLRDLPSGLTPEDALARLRAFLAAAVEANSPEVTRSDAKTASTSSWPQNGASVGEPRTSWEPAPDDGPPAARHTASGEAPVLDAAAAPERHGLFDAAWRLLTFRRFRAPFVPPSEQLLFGLGVLTLACWAIVNRLHSGARAEFSPQGLTGLTWYILMGITVAWVLSRRTYPATRFRSALFALLVVLPVLIGASAFMGAFVPTQWAPGAAYALAIYAVIYVACAARSLAGGPQIPAVASALLVIGGFTWVAGNLYVDTTLWYVPDPDGAAPTRLLWEKGESLLFDQPAHIDTMLARMKPSTPTAANVYFLGFAGVGEQRVFAQEIKLAAHEVGRRYGSGERSLLLLNDRRDLDSYPLATVSGLRRALQGIASRMDRDRDILFLALSSHGSRDPYIAVSNSYLQLRQLTGRELAGALKDSGIKWKVIVISACYAGAFIDALRDDHTIILTAAAADRTSFGCSDTRELTYFGEAFYRDALPHSASLHDAFASASASIAAREKAEGIKASLPQAFFGTALDTKLSDLESRQLAVTPR